MGTDESAPFSKRYWFIISSALNLKDVFFIPSGKKISSSMKCANVLSDMASMTAPSAS